MTVSLPPAPPVTTVEAAVSQMQAIAAALPVADGVACFNRMYLEVTQQVESELSLGSFGDPGWMSALDVTFANLYFAAVEAGSESVTGGASVPAAWGPLFAQRDNPEITSLQFALAGMNAHINHDLPIALVQTCQQRGSSPEAGTHHADYQKVDALLDAAEQSTRQSFESGAELGADKDVQPVLDLVANWSINSARDVAWDTGLALWLSRDIALVEDMLMNSLARTVAMASSLLLVAVS
ncbi:MAG TPA: DUF5995 family protein [Acidimicrobiales bacterium]|jgi:hypothetical protein|nr:DUF5995 family protein [Acidimicrobiales bacterium]